MCVCVSMLFSCSSRPITGLWSEAFSMQMLQSNAKKCIPDDVVVAYGGWDAKSLKLTVISSRWWAWAERRTAQSRT